MIRKPYVEGKFYPDDINELSSFLTENIKDLKPKSRIIVSPHAGYVYSGKTAAKAFSHFEKDFETVFVIATAHTVYAPACFLTKDRFETVLGSIDSDEEVIDILLRNKAFKLNPQAHTREHSVEVVLPFLKYIKKDFKLVAVVVNGEDKDILIEAGREIAKIMKEKKAVCVISSDLSHYPPYDISKTVDEAFSLSYQIATINKDIDYLFLSRKLISEKYINYLDTLACGFAPMVVGLATAIEYGYSYFEILELINSGDIVETKGEVVGYLAGCFLDKKTEFKLNLTDKEKKYLLDLARKSIRNYLENKTQLEINHYPFPKLNLPFALFVTLTIKGKLRGCIGSLTPHMIIGDGVCEYAIKAGFEDPRFSPLSLEELKDIKIEISILSPLKKINDISEIKQNIHGVYVRHGFRSGTYLPQVWEHFKTKEEFLRSLFEDKAGIDYSFINHSNTEIYIYTVEAFEE